MLFVKRWRQSDYSDALWNILGNKLMEILSVFNTTTCMFILCPRNPESRDSSEDLSPKIGKNILYRNVH